ncbi:TXNDC15, partial [Cordylochernes scorpioides]
MDDKVLGVKVPQVEAVNMTVLLDRLTPSNQTTGGGGECTLVLFFSPWCPFSAKAVPHFSALARAYPGLWLYAIDAVTHNHLQMKYGLISVPTILLFHNGRAIAKFNDSVPSLPKLNTFVSRITGLYHSCMVALSADF